jgi:plasmid stabilization system protein ParE
MRYIHTSPPTIPLQLGVVGRILRSIELLGEHPNLGFPWRSTTTRALMVPGLRFRIHYEIIDETVVVLTIVHTRQKPPNGF